MTPPPTAGEVTGPPVLAVRRERSTAVGGSVAHALGPSAWPRVRFLVDVVVLCLASSAALFAAQPVVIVGPDRALAAVFPLLVLAMMYARRAPDDRLSGSLLDAAAHILGVVSLGAMLTVALGSMIGGDHPLDIALPLWIFAGFYLGVARLVLLWIRRHAMQSKAYATPTLIVGAGVVGQHLVRHLISDPRYGFATRWIHRFGSNASRGHCGTARHAGARRIS